MKNDIKKHIKSMRLKSLPESMRQELKAARLKRGWSQAELGMKAGLPQMHISGIETGKIVPRFDTLLDFIRVLDYDLLLIPRSLVPITQALIREHTYKKGAQSLYAVDDDNDDDNELNETEQRHNEF
jgi:transcriptional regulator with XRE-family HTH domain